jgi:hypothetical protein
LIEYAGGETQLFDLARDPHEMCNLAERAEFGTAATEGRRRLARLAPEWDDAAHPMGRDFWSARTDLTS